MEYGQMLFGAYAAKDKMVKFFGNKIEKNTKNIRL